MPGGLAALARSWWTSPLTEGLGPGARAGRGHRGDSTAQRAATGLPQTGDVCPRTAAGDGERTAAELGGQRGLRSEHRACAGRPCLGAAQDAHRPRVRPDLHLSLARALRDTLLAYSAVQLLPCAIGGAGPGPSCCATSCAGLADPGPNVLCTSRMTLELRAYHGEFSACGTDDGRKASDPPDCVGESLVPLPLVGLPFCACRAGGV